MIAREELPWPHDQPLYTAGIDEAGRGPLAGPVVAAAVILDPARPVSGLKDSKVLTALDRERLAAEIRESALAWGVGSADHEEIDHFNILQATHLAMLRAVAALAQRPELVLVDGNRSPAFGVMTRTVIGGDATVAAISAASIIAKVTRDTLMIRMAEQYPGYGFEQHKGYATELHRHALMRLGPSPIHRLTFAPVREVSLNPLNSQGLL
jgi:ribonuclease HII